VHEFVDGPTFRVREKPVRIASRFNVGGRVTTTPQGSQTASVYELAFDYGDYFTGENLGPFDAFEVTGRLNLPEPRPVADFHIVGVLAGGPVGGQTGNWRHVLGVFQHLDYYHPEGTQYGGQSVGAGLRSRWSLADNLNLRFSSDLNWMIAGAASSEFYKERIPRDYDHGTGVGLKLSADVGNSSFAFGRIAYSGHFLHTLDGPSDNHLVHFMDATAYVPLFRGVGIGAAYQWYSRRTNNPAAYYPDVHRSESEVRAYVGVRFN
jgi:hypothetical protein